MAKHAHISTHIWLERASKLMASGSEGRRAFAENTYDHTTVTNSSRKT